MSIKHEEKINFKAKSYKETKIKSLDNNLLAIISIYGPNGGGKSSIIHSLFMLINLIKVNIDKQKINSTLNQINIYKNSTQKNKPIIWKMHVISHNKRYYKYSISVNNNEIIHESLEYSEKLDGKYENVFNRTSSSEYKLGESFNNIRLRAIDFGSLLSYLYTNIDNEFIVEFYNEINKFFAFNNLFNDPIVLVPNPLIPKIQYNINRPILEKEKDKFLKLFKEIDVNIIDYKFTNNLGNEHLILVKNNENGTFELDFSLESEGTKKIIQLMSYFFIGIHDGWTFVIDELDSRLHTKLLGYIIDLFHSKQNKKSQIIFTSHDMNTLNPKYLRKDEVYFAALNESYFTNLISLSSFEDIRNKSSYSSQYLSGKLGYDPYISRAIKWLDDEKK
ncbi:MAG: AAA family ATPase [Mycoplasma sp.]|nr:AAA family ATPase [Mycoplasma sp.]